MNRREKAQTRPLSEIENVKKNKFFKELETLKFQCKTLERENGSQIFIKRADFQKHYNELHEHEVMLNEELQNEKVKIDQHLGKVKNKVTVFQEQLKDVKPTPEFVEKLRQMMEDIEATITAFKQQQRKMFESLLTEEGSIDHEIEIIQSRIRNLAAANSDGTTTKPVSARQAQTSSSLPPEVKAFEKYVSQFGQQGGWDDYDHSSFLKVRNRFKGKLSFMRVAVNSIPGRTFEDVKEHEGWYQKYLQLQNAKKAAIAEWKLNKELEQPKPPVAEEDVREIEKRKREKEKREEEERQQKKKELEEWKAKKAEQERLEQEEIERNEKRKKKLRDQQESQLNDIRSAARERLRAKKEEEERRRWRKETEEEEWRALRAEQAQAEIARFQNRDQRSLEVKRKEKQRKEEEERIKKERIERARAAVKVQADRNRLYRPTDAWIQRGKQQRERTDSNSMVNLPHRAVPSWRQGV